MRLDKFLSENTELTRSRIQVAIKQGEVKVNHILAHKGDQKVSENELITLNDIAVIPSRNCYYMLNKPAGYICANQDASHPTVMDLIELPNKHKLQIVGRLDIDTTGLVLLTDDGEWNHRITSPRHKCVKVYCLTAADPISSNAAERFLSGVQLQGEPKPTLPAILEQIDSHTAKLSIQEGKYHQVKRMLAAIGNRVTSLHRESVGGIHLDSSLAPGEYRALTLDELAGA